MKINDKEYTIENLISDIDFNKNKLVKINDNLFLTNYQIEILNRFDINYSQKNSLKEIIYEAEEAYEDTLDEELEIILNELSERDYYENTNK